MEILEQDLKCRDHCFHLVERVLKSSPHNRGRNIHCTEVCCWCGIWRESIFPDKSMETGVHGMYLPEKTMKEK